MLINIFDVFVIFVLPKTYHDTHRGGDIDFILINWKLGTYAQNAQFPPLFRVQYYELFLNWQNFFQKRAKKTINNPAPAKVFPPFRVPPAHKSLITNL